MKHVFSILMAAALVLGITSMLTAAGKGDKVRKRDRTCQTTLTQEARQSAVQCAGSQDRDRARDGDQIQDRDRDRDQDGSGANCRCGGFVDEDGDGLCDNCGCTCDGDGPYGPQGPRR